MDENKKQKLNELLGGLDIKDEGVDSKSIKRILKDIFKAVKEIKIKEYDDSFNDISSKIDTIPQREYDEYFVEVLDRIEELPKDIPEVDLSPIVDAIRKLNTELSSRITAVEEKPDPIFPPFPKIPSPIDHSKELSKINTILLTILGEVTKKDDAEKIKQLEEKVGKLFTLSSGGGNMPQAWKEDSTADSSLSGTVNGVNTVFTLSQRAVNGVVFLFRNGNLESLNSFSVGSDQRTITYSGFPPQSGDVIQARYPK